MNTQEFDAEMRRIGDTFGKKNYDLARTEMIWGFVREMEAKQFKSIVNHLIGSSRRAPLPVDFKEAAAAERRNSTGARDALSSDIKCSCCKDVGTIQAWRRGVRFKHASTFSFRCPERCEASLALTPQIQFWGSHFEKDYLHCFGTNKTADEIWSERHEELYGFPESDRMPKARVNVAMQDLAAKALEAMKRGPVQIDDADVDDIPF